jgi:hypothetical protein
MEVLKIEIISCPEKMKEMLMAEIQEHPFQSFFFFGENLTVHKIHNSDKASILVGQDYEIIATLEEWEKVLKAILGKD